MFTHRRKPHIHDIVHGILQVDLFQVILAGSLLIISFHILLGALLDLPVANLAKNTLMQLLGIFLPGLALYVALYPSRQNLLGALFLSYAFGYAGNIISYFLLVPFKLQIAVPFFVIFIAVLSLWWLRRQCKNFSLDKLKRIDLIYVFLFLLYLCLRIIVAAGTVAPPFSVNVLSFNQDYLYWLENAAALARQFPPTDPRLAIGGIYYYHYFSSIQLAFSSLATGVDLYTLGGILFPLTQCLLFFGSFYVLFRSTLKSHLISIFGLAVTFFCTGLEWILITTYTAHTWTNPFGYDIGLSFGALFLHCLFLQYEKGRFSLRTCVITALFFAVTTGAKAPIAAMLLIAAGIICFSWLLKKQYRHAFSYGLALLAVFLIVATVCVGIHVPPPANPTATKLGSFSATRFISESPAVQAMQEVLSDLPRLLRGIILVGTSLLYSHPLAFGLYGMGALSILTDRRMRTAPCLALLLSGFLGAVLGIFNIQAGHSQMYFLMTAFILCLFLGLIWLDTVSSDWSAPGKRTAVIICGGLLLIQVNFMLFQGVTYSGSGLIVPLRTGSAVLFNQEPPQRIGGSGGVLATDIQAMAWIRDNTPGDSILLSDRSVIGEAPLFMYYGAFSERQMYLEGDGFSYNQYVEERARMRTVIQDVFQNSNKALRTAAQEGVDYIVQTIWLTPDFSPDPSMTKLVYSTETIRVYEVTI